MKKALLTLILALGTLLSLSAATSSADSVDMGALTPIHRPITTQLLLGSNFRIGPQPDQAIFGNRQPVAFGFGLRMSGYFTPHWGAYGDIHLKFYRTRYLTPSFSDKFTEAIAEMFFPGISHIKGSLGAGVTYRYEHGRWQLYPRLGLGWHMGTHSTKSTSDKQHTITLERDNSVLYLATGIAFGFRTSRVCSLILDINFQQPLTAAKATFTTSQNSSAGEGPKEVTSFSTHALGRDLTLSLGIQFQTDLSGKK